MQNLEAGYGSETFKNQIYNNYEFYHFLYLIVMLSVQSVCTAGVFTCTQCTVPVDLSHLLLLTSPPIANTIVPSLLRRYFQAKGKKINQVTDLFLKTWSEVPIHLSQKVPVPVVLK